MMQPDPVGHHSCHILRDAVFLPIFNVNLIIFMTKVTFELITDYCSTW